LEYTDRRFPAPVFTPNAPPKLDESWLKYKPQTPFGHIPVLSVDGRVVAESGAIARYIATIGGLRSADPFEAAVQDSIVDAVFDIARTYFQSVKFNKDLNDEQKKTKLAGWLKDDFPKAVEPLERMLHKNEYFVNNKVSYADIRFYHTFASLLSEHSTLLDAFPALKALVARVAARPRIASWLAARPVTAI